MFILCRKMICFILAFALVTLSGCVGGPIARQIASSMAMRVADNATASIVESQERKDEEARHTMVFKDTPPDPYWAAFVTSGFTQVTPIVEPLPADPQANQSSDTTPAAQVSRLVRVELWNMLTNEEKQAVLERSSKLGATDLPPKSEWPQWKVAAGGLENQKGAAIYFLIPPDFGHINSGDKAVVEISSLGGLHFARYRLN
jgi:hypothetical protein